MVCSVVASQCRSTGVAPPRMNVGTAVTEKSPLLLERVGAAFLWRSKDPGGCHAGDVGHWHAMPQFLTTYAKKDPAGSFFLAICRILWYGIGGAASTPVGDSPDCFLSGVNTSFCPQSVSGGGDGHGYMGRTVSVLHGHCHCHCSGFPVQ